MNRHALLQRVSVFGSLNWLKRESAVLRRGWFLGGLVAYSRGSVTVNQKLAGFHESAFESEKNRTAPERKKRPTDSQMWWPSLEGSIMFLSNGLNGLHLFKDKRHRG